MFVPNFSVLEALFFIFGCLSCNGLGDKSNPEEKSIYIFKIALILIDATLEAYISVMNVK